VERRVRAPRAVRGDGARSAASYEIIFIEDGSRDRTFERLRQIRAEDPAVRVFRFRAQLRAERRVPRPVLAAARGGLIVTMDGDLQNTTRPTFRALLRPREFSATWCAAGGAGARTDWLTRHVPSVTANWLLNVYERRARPRPGMFAQGLPGAGGEVAAAAAGVPR
jgi:glycosyltransferase involved in cell wall biosynthesis